MAIYSWASRRMTPSNQSIYVELIICMTGRGGAENYYGNACPDAGLARDGQRDAIPLKPIAVAVSGGTLHPI